MVKICFTPLFWWAYEKRCSVVNDLLSIDKEGTVWIFYKLFSKVEAVLKVIQRFIPLKWGNPKILNLILFDWNWNGRWQFLRRRRRCVFSRAEKSSPPSRSNGDENYANWKLLSYSIKSCRKVFRSIISAEAVIASFFLTTRIPMIASVLFIIFKCSR